MLWSTRGSGSSSRAHGCAERHQQSAQTLPVPAWLLQKDSGAAASVANWWCLLDHNGCPDACVYTHVCVLVNVMEDGISWSGMHPGRMILATCCGLCCFANLGLSGFNLAVMPCRPVAFLWTSSTCWGRLTTLRCIQCTQVHSAREGGEQRGLQLDTVSCQVVVQTDPVCQVIFLTGCHDVRLIRGQWRAAGAIVAPC